ncbi:MAG TPA: dihydroorotate dehydrogenase, partial [Roseiflexaceae bacterium]|nr:dihydroorotate dehydrogenase [Roseiflexaceae bacterium]
MPIDLAPHNAYGLILTAPVMTAAGCFGFGVEYARFGMIEQLGAIVTRPVTLNGRRRHPPQLIETPAGLLRDGNGSAVGLATVLERYAPIWAAWQTPVIVHVAADHVAVAAALEGVEGIAGIELTVTADAIAAAALIARVRAVTLLPLLAKLPLHEALPATARAVHEAGADALVLCSSPRGMAYDPVSGQPIEGWISGPALRPFVLQVVADTAARLGVPLVA